MELPVTPKPMLASSPNLPTNHSGKLFGIVYITLTGVIDTIIPAASPWSWVGKSTSYLLKLAPVTSDKLLLTMLTDKPQLRDSNPDSLRAASPQDQLPGRLQIFGLKPEQDLTLENPLKLDEPKSSTLILPIVKVPVSLTNQQAGLAIEPKITWAFMEGEIEKLPNKCGPPKDGQPSDLTRKFKYSQFKPVNVITPAIDATKDWKNLVNGNTRAREIYKRFPMTDGHTYTLDRQEDAHCHSCNKVT
ncbi:hypothetical protein DSO57_1027023 [Entomophthora muscae]|uniref:Uncharacterized protein n=1 Tax=Entomophthora muscae TaxID=34485 RepID=A0ACC2SR60_9FUNG|nr:hypothetical protein DSO57_1027023 [Entomophthora muscae]